MSKINVKNLREFRGNLKIQSKYRFKIILATKKPLRFFA
jgi:hypothetical protein